MKKSVKLIVKGTVQGVFYRQFCKENADKLGVNGFIRNLENGDVEVVLEGNNDEVDMMIKLCKQGPKHAQIRDVEVEEKKWSGEFKDFRILRF